MMIKYKYFFLIFLINLFNLINVQAQFWGQSYIAQSYQEVLDQMKQIVQNNPQNAELFILGKNDDGVEIQGLKIGKGEINNLVVASHHGNEYGSVEVARAFADSIAQNPIADQTLYVVPVLNISGYNYRDRYEHGYDPNRDYPGPCGTEGPHALKSTKALAEFIDANQIVASATLHTYWPGVFYPWGISTHDVVTIHQDLFIQLAKAGAFYSNYLVGNSTEIIYPADGTFEDYAYWKHGIWSLLFELGPSHTPTQSEVDQMIEVNVPGLRKMFEEAPKKRAENYEFTGKCDPFLRILDRHIE